LRGAPVAALQEIDGSAQEQRHDVIGELGDVIHVAHPKDLT
jgi:hypothetical protein